MRLEWVESFWYWVQSFAVAGDADALCRIRSPINEHAFTTTSGDLFSLIRVMGAKNFVGPAEAELMSERAAQCLSAIIRSGNGRLHAFAVGFKSNPAGGPHLAQRALDPMVRTAKRYGCVDIDVFADRHAVLSLQTTDESVYLVIRTCRQGLTPNEIKRMRAVANKAALDFNRDVKAKVPALSDDFVQNPQLVATALLPRHEATLANLLETLNRPIDANGAGLLAEMLNAHEAISMIRSHLGAEIVPDGWRPRLVGDVRGGVATQHPGDWGGILPARIGRQIVQSSMREEFADAEMCQRGGVWYASLVLEQFPDAGSELFVDLASRIERRIPWNVAFEASPGGLNVRQWEQILASFMAAFGGHNKRIRRAWEHLKEIAESGEVVMALQAVFTTWGASKDECLDNLSFLRSAVEAWGSACVTNETGAPAIAALAGAAGFTSQIPAPILAVPMPDLTRMLPLLRPSSIWQDGHLIARTAEGRLYPVKFGTSEQDFWGTGICAPPGRGKSFLMNMLNLGVMFAPGRTEMPNVVVVDVGPSSALVMQFVQAMLPQSMRNQVLSVRITNSEEFAVNPFDTQLGVDQPTPSELDFLVLVVETICPGLGVDGSRLIPQVIRRAYRMFGRESSQCKHWQPTLDLSLERAREQAGIPFEQGKTRVWDLVDAFFDAGMVEEALSAQRFASPVLADLIRAVNDAEIVSIFETARSETGERLTDAFIRAVTTGVEEYRLLSAVTRFDVGNARCISIDLEEVVSSQSEEGRRRSALMYMFARRLGARNFFLRWDDELMPITPHRYHDHHRARIVALQESLKFLEYDEVHNASGVPSMQRLLAKDLREGRKYNMVTLMASQLLTDFSSEIVENCFNFFILGVGSSQAAGRMRETFSLSDSEISAIERECVGPGRLFGLFKTRRGTISQILRTTAGPLEMWAFNTDAVDRTLRTLLTQRMNGDYLGALKLLAKEFPKGSARKRIEAMQMRAGSSSTSAASDSYARQLADELLEEYLASVS